MRASPKTPANGGQSLPQWITHCYNGVGVGGDWLGGLLDCWLALLIWVWFVCWVCCFAVEGLGGRFGAGWWFGSPSLLGEGVRG